MDYTYRVQRIACRGGRTLLVVLDLGFGLPKQHEFLLLGVSADDEPVLRGVMAGGIGLSEEIVLRSIKRSDGEYYADVSYLLEDRWYNLSRDVLRRKKEVTS